MPIPRPDISVTWLAVENPGRELARPSGNGELQLDRPDEALLSLRVATALRADQILECERDHVPE